MKRWRAQRRTRRSLPSTRGHRSTLPAVGVSLLANILADPAHVAAALCQMATLAHVAGHRRKRNEAVVAAAELLGHREYISRRANRALLINPLPS